MFLQTMSVDSERQTTELKLFVRKIENVNIVILKCLKGKQKGFFICTPVSTHGSIKSGFNFCLGYRNSSLRRLPTVWGIHNPFVCDLRAVVHFL